ncbi:NACHT domain-containing protein [Shewanella colwelliana]|uniref:NACHT domain-containing protein n=1 Tax=Shewanella colwelliana TaxID=23 RepID=UPI0037364366
MPLLETIATKGLTSFAVSITKKLADKGWNRVSEEIGAIFTEESIRAYCKSCNEYVHLRTLYSSQKDVFIDDVYVPLYMSPINDELNKIEITNLSFYSDGITCITGKAGQGKSTFLRKMLLNELKKGEYLPVFFELKNFNVEKSFIEQLVVWFNRHGLNTNQKGVERLLKGGDLKLFLDGFDEIPPLNHDKVLEEIKNISRTYDETTIIVTTRPDTLITTEPFISNYRVLDLSLKNVNELFLKISGNDIEKTADAMAQINKYSKIKDIVKTPILAILLFITYRAWSNIPDNLSDFYKKIFITLLTHHDAIKAGKKIDRGMNIPLNDNQMEDIFSVFCFLTFNEGVTNFSFKEASQFMQQSIEAEGVEDVCPQNFVDVIKRCTGIICSNGYDDLTFSHKSLQEYYTALYISVQSNDDRRAFYKSAKEFETEAQYSAVLSYLSGLDTAAYVKHYYIPCYKSLFMFTGTIPKECPDIEDLLRGFNKASKDILINFAKDKKENLPIPSFGFNLASDITSFLAFRILHLVIYSAVKSDIFMNIEDEKSNILINNFDENDTCIVTLNDFLSNCDKTKKDLFISYIRDNIHDIVLLGHDELIKKLKVKNKRSMVSKVFKKNKRQAETIS